MEHINRKKKISMKGPSNRNIMKAYSSSIAVNVQMARKSMTFTNISANGGTRRATFGIAYTSIGKSIFKSILDTQLTWSIRNTTIKTLRIKIS